MSMTETTVMSKHFFTFYLMHLIITGITTMSVNGKPVNVQIKWKTRNLNDIIILPLQSLVTAGASSFGKLRQAWSGRGHLKFEIIIFR